VADKPSLQTRLIHNDYQPPEGFDAFPPAIHHASTVYFKDMAALRAQSGAGKPAYTYGLHATPTSLTLQARLADIEGGTHCLLAPSGSAAITMIDFALLKSGDDLLVPDNVYTPNRELSNWLKRDYGVSARFYDPMIGAGIADLIQENTRLIWTEAPGSVSMEVPDLRAICAAAKGKGVIVALDNTWSAGIALQAFELGVDIVMQALTKYQSGGSDVLMGAVITRDAELDRRIALARRRLGLGVAPDDCYLVLRGLSSMKLRFDAHDAAARQVASWLKARNEISRVLHPAFSDCPGHENWKRDFSGAGGLFSVIFDASYSQQQIDAFIDRLALFRIGYSWGGATSLCVPYDMKTMRNRWLHKGQLVRFYIGLEEPKELIADIEQALAALS
jgi:cystathionine beta-lyase